MDRTVWINLAAVPDDRLTGLATAALEQGFSHLVIAPAQRERVERLGRFRPLVRQDDGVSSNGAIVAEWVTIRGAADEERAAQLAHKREAVVVSATDWKIIPLENLIARFQKAKAQLLAEVSTAEEARTMFATLEVGTHGVVLTPRSAREVVELARLLRTQAPRLSLEEATVRSVVDAGVGERVCVDTCSLLRPGEGMLVGSAARCLFLVHSESLESEYVAARPFRVNAGAVFSYVLGPEGRSRYLSEVRAGLPLLAVDHAGSARAVVTGRAKVETRPLLLVDAELSDGTTAQVILQNAETIRLTRPGGGAVSVVELKPGDRVLVARAEAGRHFGHAVRETVLER